ncbi:MAG: OmpA family protein [Methylobacteriaceae bacterium]|nr:OmpA family protein [Methylobacteriaceae bacterium]
MNRPAGQSEFEFDRLKHLLLAPETDRLTASEARIDALDQRVGTPDRLEAATSEILVEAFRKAEIARHRELAGAVAPVVVAAIRNEIKNSKDMMVEALYPITGRLVTAAVANAFRDLVADLNERLDRSLSTRYWRLRFRSMITGRPLSELALAEAQRPELRRLLLLERGSGRLVAAWHADDETDDQSELVSGLIAAITEFASSVYGSRSGELRTLDLGQARVFLRGAPVYLVAAECAGALRPEHEREVDDAFLSLVSRIDHAPDDATPALAHMAETLFQQRLPAEKKSSLPLVLVGAALLALLAWWASGPILRGLHERRIDAAFAQALTAHPDLDAFPLRVTVDHAARTVTLAGLAPSDADSHALVDAIKGVAAPYKVVAHTASVGSVAQLRDMSRREDALGGELNKIDQELSALGKQLSDARARIDANGVGLDAVGPQIAAVGAADREAIGKTEAAMRALRMETRAVRDKLAALETAATPTARAKAQALASRTAIYFARDDAFADPALAARRADEIAAALKSDANLALRVVGHTDSSGNEQRNARIARSRAEAVVALLVARGIEAGRLRAVARASADAGAAQSDPRDRRVTFELAPQDEARP